MALRIRQLAPKPPVTVDVEQLRSVATELCPDASTETREVWIEQYSRMMNFQRLPNLHTAAATEYLEGLAKMLNEKLSPATEVTPERILASALRYQERAGKSSLASVKLPREEELRLSDLRPSHVGKRCAVRDRGGTDPRAGQESLGQVIGRERKVDRELLGGVPGELFEVHRTRVIDDLGLGEERLEGVRLSGPAVLDDRA